MAALFFISEALAQSQARCSHNGQCGDDGDNDCDDAGVSIRFLMSQLRYGEHSNDCTTVWQRIKAASCHGSHSVNDLRISAHGDIILCHGLHEDLQTTVRLQTLAFCCSEVQGTEHPTVELSRDVHERGLGNEPCRKLAMRICMGE